MTLRKLKYRPAAHAIERLREYFGVKEIHALDFSNETMVNAKFVTTQTDRRRLYKNDELDVMIVVAEDNTIITYLPAPEKRREIERTGKPLSIKSTEYISKSQRLSDAITATVKREIAKARRTFTATTRALSEQHALLQIEFGKLNLNKVRCKHPATQAIIQRKIGAITTQMETLASDIERTESEYKALRAEAAALIGQEVAQ